MYGVHKDMMDKVDELDKVVRGIPAARQLTSELRRLVTRAWNETDASVGGFGPPYD